MKDSPKFYIATKFQLWFVKDSIDRHDKYIKIFVILNNLQGFLNNFSFALL